MEAMGRGFLVPVLKRVFRSTSLYDDGNPRYLSWGCFKDEMKSHTWKYLTKENAVLPSRQGEGVAVFFTVPRDFTVTHAG